MKKRMNHNFKRAVSGALTAAMVISGIPAQSLSLTVGSVYAAENFRLTGESEYKSVVYGETVTLDAGQYVEAEEGTVVTYTWKKYNQKTETYEIIEGATESTYDAVMEEIPKSYDIAAFVCEVSENGETDAVDFYITDVDTQFELEDKEWEETNLYVKYGEEISLSVSASSNAPIHYQWYYVDKETSQWTLLEGAEEATYTTQAGKGTASRYRCVADDGYYNGWNTMEFYVSVDSEFSLDYNSYQNVKYGEKKTLSVSASSLSDEITYQWEYWNDEASAYQTIEGATTSTYEVTGDQNLASMYRCRVSDGVVSSNASFSTSVDTGFNIDYDYYNTVKYGKTKELEVKAESEAGLALSYQWYVYDEEKYNEDNYSYYWPIEGANTNTYSVTGKKGMATRYRCQVSDGINNSDCDFSVSLDTGFKMEYDSDVTVPYQGKAELKVTASTNTDDGLGYQWYVYDQSKGYNEDRWDYYWPVEGAVEAAYEVDGTKDMKTRYMCIVTDGVVTREASFYLTLDSGLKLEDYESNVTVLYAQKKPLEVKAQAVEDITYQWYAYNSREYNSDTKSYYWPIEGATTATYEIEGTEERVKAGSQNVKCIVSDGITTQSAEFYVSFESGLEVETNSYSYINVKYQKDETLEAAAKSTTGRTLTYQWYVDSDNNYQYQAIDGATESKLTVKGEKGLAQRYRCILSDGIETRTLTFYTTLDSGLEVSYESDVKVKYQKTADLKVNAKTDSPEGITYTWYQYDSLKDEYNLLEDAKTDTYTVKGEKGLPTRFKCIVKDGVETEDIEFYTDLDTGLRVTCDSRVLLRYGEEGEISVNAVSESNLPLTYTWSYYTTDENGYEELQVMPNEKTAKVKVSVAKDTPVEYRCSVTDGIATDFVTIKVVKDTGLNIVYESNAPVVYHDTKELTVTAESEFDLPLTYQWYKGGKYYGNYTLIEGATKADYTVTGDENLATTYKCVISDGIATKEAVFSTKLDSQLKIDFEEFNTIPYGEQGELKVNAASGVNLPITYQWYVGNYYNDDAIEGETSGTLALTGTKDLSKYYSCKVSDGIKTEIVELHVTLDTGLKVSRPGDTYVPYGQTKDLTVTATSALDNPISYQWYARNSKTYGYDKIEGATENAYTVTGDENLAETYRCVVSDTIIEEEEYIYTLLDTGLKVENERLDTDIELGETVELAVKAESCEALPLQYQWYAYDGRDYKEIEGATQAAYTIKGEKGMPTSYQCKVSNGIDYKYVQADISLVTGLNIEYAGNTEVKVDEEKTLQVFAETGIDEALTYTWYVYDNKRHEYKKLEDVTGTFYTITGALGQPDKYKCEVSDGVMTKTAQFDISIDSGLKVDYETSRVKVLYGETADLKVNVTSESGLPITYKWYKQNPGSYYTDYYLISGENTDTYSVKGIRGMVEDYRCEISDGINTATVDFTAILDSGLEVDYEYYPTLKYGEKGTLEVSATTKSGGELRYQWYAMDENHNYQEIAGATSSSYEVMADKDMSRQYQCKVSDDITSQTVYMYVSIDTGLTINKVEQYQTVNAGEKLSLKVEASSDYSNELTYQWEKTDSETDRRSDIEGATTDTYVVTGEQGAEGWYYCTVSDGISRQTIRTYITVDSGLSVKAENVTVEYEKTADIKVVAESKLGKEIQYQWYAYNKNIGDYKLISGATKDTYTITGEKNTPDSYMCKVSDGIVTREAYINVTLDTGLTVTASSTDVTVAYNGSKELAVLAESKSGNELTYKWYDSSWATVDYLLAGETTSKLTIQGTKDTSRYYTCKVSDGIKTEEITFYVTVDTGFKVEYESRIAVEYNKEAECKVTAKTDLPGGVSYEWRAFREASDGGYVGIPIEGANSSVLKVKADESIPEWVTCTVTDGINTREADFYFDVDSKLTVTGGKTVILAAGDKTKLEVKAESAIGEELTYQWYRTKTADDDWYDEEIIKGANSAVLEVTGDEEYDYSYRCRVSDRYSSQSVVFNVFTKADWVYGDVDGDGTAGAQDAVMLKQYLAGYTDLDMNKKAADVNLDGRISSADAVLLLQKLAGYDVTLGQ